jgi:membrane-associated phospholipid phosphatase
MSGSSAIARIRSVSLRPLVTTPVLVLVALSIALCAIFLQLGDEVHEGDTTSTDQSILRRIDAETATVPVAVANTTSLPGAEIVVGGVGVALALTFLLRRQLLDALFITGAVGGYAALTFIVKDVVQRERPIAFFRIPESGYSFPSGHTLGTTCLAVAVGYFIWHSRWNVRTKVAGTVALTILVTVVGGSRLVLGVHYPADVLGGLLLGGAWMSILIAARTVAERWQSAHNRTPSRS